MQSFLQLLNLKIFILLTFLIETYFVNTTLSLVGAGSNEYSQSMFGTKTKKNVHACTLNSDYINVGYKEVYFSWTCYPDDLRYLPIVRLKNWPCDNASTAIFFLSQYTAVSNRSSQSLIKSPSSSIATSALINAGLSR